MLVKASFEFLYANYNLIVCFVNIVEKWNLVSSKKTSKFVVKKNVDVNTTHVSKCVWLIHF